MNRAVAVLFVLSMLAAILESEPLLVQGREWLARPTESTGILAAPSSDALQRQSRRGRTPHGD